MSSFTSCWIWPLCQWNYLQIFSTLSDSFYWNQIVVEDEGMGYAIPTKYWSWAYFPFKIIAQLNLYLLRSFFFTQSYRWCLSNWHQDEGESCFMGEEVSCSCFCCSFYSCWCFYFINNEKIIYTKVLEICVYRIKKTAV